MWRRSSDGRGARGRNAETTNENVRAKNVQRDREARVTPVLKHDSQTKNTMLLNNETQFKTQPLVRRVVSLIYYMGIVLGQSLKQGRGYKMWTRNRDVLARMPWDGSFQRKTSLQEKTFLVCMSVWASGFEPHGQLLLTVK